MAAVGCAVFGFSVGSVTGFVAKQVFAYHFLSPIKDRLQEAITHVAISRIGDFAAGIIGRELAMTLSIPVTQFFSDLVYGAVKTTIESIIALVSRWLFPQRDILISKGFSDVAAGIFSVVKKIVSCASFFFSRAYFCHYGMPLIREVAQLILQHCITAPIFFPAIGASMLVPAISALVAISITPPITFFLGDLVGSACSELSSFFLDRAVDLIC